MGFQPVALICWTTGNTASGDAADSVWSFGIDCGLQSASVLHAQANNSTTTRSAAYSFQQGGPVFLKNTIGTNYCNFVVSAYTATGATLNWQAVSSGTIVHYLALGGTECSAQSQSIFTQRTTTGTQAVTGTGFQPKVVFFLYGTGNAETTGVGFGCAMSSTARWAFSESTANAASMTSTALISRIQDTTKCISLLTSGGSTTVLAAADLVSMDANGFTLNWTTATATAFNIGYWAFGGSGQFATGSFTKAANTTETTATVNAGFTTAPSAYMVVSTAAVGNTAQSTGWRGSIGASDGTSFNSVCWENKNGVINTQARRYSDAGSGAATVVRQRGLPTSISAAGANEVVMDHNSFTSNGFVLDYVTNAQAFAWIYPWVAFGGAPITEPTLTLQGPADSFTG